jgi:hypothetical protein
VQAAGFSQSYNRYSYCLNNPLKYTDPSGYVFGVDDAIIILAMVYMGGMQANWSYSASQGTNPFNPGNWNWSSPGTYAGLASGLSSGLTFTIGGMFGHGVGSLGNELLRAGAHGALGGTMSWANGGSFWQGFAVSGVSSLAGSGMQALGWSGDYLPLATGAAGAGTAWVTGGDPMSGFMQGFSIGLLNHNGGEGTEKSPFQLDEVVVLGRGPLLSKHLYLSDAIYSQTAIRKNINNRPTIEHIENLKILGREVYDKIYERFDGNIRISSGYRSAELNKAVGGSSTSQHLLGQALDIQGTGKVSNSQIFDYVRDNLQYHQLIWEYGTAKNPNWVHIGYRPFGNNGYQIFSVPKWLRTF